MKLPLVIGLGALFLASAAAAEAAPPPAPTTETARLAGLCRVWGVVKYFHPYLAYQPIDWDAALVAAIPKVRAAQTSAEYADAVDSMLATLHDPNTHVIRPLAFTSIQTGRGTRQNKSAPAPPELGAGGPAQPSVQTLPDGTAVITATQYGQFTDYAAMGALAKVLQGVKSAPALVFDLRRQDGATGINDLSEFILSQALIRALPGLLSQPLALPVSRHRMHSGYVPDDGDNHGGYFAAFVTAQGRFLPAEGDPGVHPKPMAFVLNAGSVDIHDILGGMQAAHLASVIYEGASGEESGVDTQAVPLPGGLTAQVRLSETVNPSGTLGFRPDVVVPAGTGAIDPAMDAALKAVHAPATALPPGAGAPSVYGAALPDSGYAEMAFPTAEYRLLALFRFWNIIQYVYPYKDLIGRPWGDVLTEYIPRMEADADAHAYGVTAAEMIAEIHDSHGDAYIPALNTDGHWMPPVVLREVQGQTVVAALPDPKATPGLHVGDAITVVDGEPVAARRGRLGRRHAASTPQALSEEVSFVLLVGRKTAPAVLLVRDAAGRLRRVTLPRTVRYVLPPPRKTPVYGVLASGLGYIDLGRLTPQDVGRAFAAVAKTRGLIFDMRGYPNGTAWAVAPYLASHRVVGARFEVPEPQSPDDTSVSRSDAPIVPDPAHHYGGRVAVLIDESAISQAEHTCLFLEATCHPQFIGTPTDGANGEVTDAVLPGGISFSFTGMSVRHGDGRQLQRVGIQPTDRVAPTIAGLRAGRDEVLEAAVRRLARSAPAPRARVRGPAARGRSRRRG